MMKIEIRVEPNLFLESSCYLEDMNVEVDFLLMESFSDVEKEFVKEIKKDKFYHLNEFYVHSDDKSFDGILTFMQKLSIEEFHYFYHHEEFELEHFTQFDQDELQLLRTVNISLMRKIKKYLEAQFDADLYAADVLAVLDRLKEISPLNVAQEIMGKKFRRVSDYEYFAFIPLRYYKSSPCRVFNDHTLMVMIPLEEHVEPLDHEEMSMILKVMSDTTRLKIISLLSNRSMYGKEISDKLKLKAPTVTHHLEQLNKIKLLHLEKVGQIKYYSLNKRRYGELMKALSKITN